jgi:hypothetical protein
MSTQTPRLIKSGGPEVAAAKDWAGDFPSGSAAREAFIAGICWERKKACNSHEQLTELVGGAILLLNGDCPLTETNCDGWLERARAVLLQVSK